MKKKMIALCMLASVSLASHAIANETQTSPKVFLNYTQQQLDHNYNQREWAPNVKEILHRYMLRSDITRQRLGNPQRFTYGSEKSEGFDFYRAPDANAPVEIFIHGGAWHAGEASAYLYPAEEFIDRGISYISLDFQPVQAVGLEGMTQEIRQAITWIYNNADKLGINRNRIYISGHSSGAHLGGVILTTNWKKLGLPENVIKGATLISGMYDLKPVRLSARSKYVPFTDKIEDDMSTQRHLDKIHTKVILGSGGLETDEFQRQTIDFYNAMKAAGKQVTLIKLPPYNHFEMMDDFGNPYNPIACQTLKMITSTSH